jgi:hypothetical protein
MRATSIRAAVAVAAAGTLGACGLFAGEPEVYDFDEHADRLTEMYNETIRLHAELDDAERRIAFGCMEAQGFTVHDEHALNTWPRPEREVFLDEYPFESFLPTVAEAAERGFWHWLNARDLPDDEDRQALRDRQEAEMREQFGGHFLDDDQEIPEFHLLEPEAQYGWYAAYFGEEKAREREGYLVGIERDVDEDGQEIYRNPKPGGCELEMLAALYGDPQAVENAEEDFDDWSGRPQEPHGDWQEMNKDYRSRIGSSDNDFLDCLADRGRGEWEFIHSGLAVGDFLENAGWVSRHSYEGAEGTYPPPPEDAPDNAEDWFAYEVAMAVDFAECGDESGYREDAAEAWHQAQTAYYLDIEAETYAWQDEMRDFLERAQEHLAS